MNEKEIFDLLQEEVKRQGILEVWSSEPIHFCDVKLNPIVMVVVPTGNTFDFSRIEKVWASPNDDDWEYFDWTDAAHRLGVGGFHKKMYKVYDKGEWLTHA